MVGNLSENEKEYIDYLKLSPNHICKHCSL